MTTGIVQTVADGLGQGIGQAAGFVALLVAILVMTIALAAVLLTLIGLRKLPWITTGTVAGLFLGAFVANFFGAQWLTPFAAIVGALVSHWYFSHHPMPIVGGTIYKFLMRTVGIVGILFSLSLGLKALTLGAAGILIIVAIPGLLGIVTWIIK